MPSQLSEATFVVGCVARATTCGPCIASAHCSDRQRVPNGRECLDAPSSLLPSITIHTNKQHASWHQSPWVTLVLFCLLQSTPICTGGSVEFSDSDPTKCELAIGCWEKIGVLIKFDSAKLSVPELWILVTGQNKIGRKKQSRF